jgi:hypothetical protein
MSEIKTKFTVEELVQVGDAIHNSECVMVMAVPIEDKKNMFISVIGQTAELSDMVYVAMRQSPEFEELLSKAILRVKLEKLAKKFEGR